MKNILKAVTPAPVHFSRAEQSKAEVTPQVLTAGPAGRPLHGSDR